MRVILEVKIDVWKEVLAKAAEFGFQTDEGEEMKARCASALLIAGTLAPGTRDMVSAIPGILFIWDRI